MIKYLIIFQEYAPVVKWWGILLYNSQLINHMKLSPFWYEPYSSYLRNPNHQYITLA